MELRIKQGRALTQTEIIYNFFKRYSDRAFSPCQIQDYFPTMLLTSIRRSMSDLARIGYLKKLNKMIIGKHGDQVHTWIYKEIKEK
jgi:hypothetical protein